MTRDRVYLLHIKEAITKVERFTAAGRAEFLASELVQDAVLRNLHTMSESTQRLSQELRDAHPEVDWTGISRFRNVVVHDYLGLDIEEVWSIIEKDLPELGRQIQRISVS